MSVLRRCFPVAAAAVGLVVLVLVGYRVVGTVLTLHRLEAVYGTVSLTRPITRPSVDALLRGFTATEVSFYDIPRPWRDSIPTGYESHLVVRYKRFNLDMHVIYDGSGQVVMSIPTYD